MRQAQRQARVRTPPLQQPAPCAVAGEGAGPLAALAAVNRVPGVIGRGGFFALSFGSMVGSGWIMLLGEWLRLAAPGGAILALLAGGLLMSVVGMCYAELAARMPRAGGELRYAMETFGPRAGFVVGWFLTLFLVAICAFEGTALAWLGGLVMHAPTAPPLYRAFGAPVTAWSLLVGSLGAVAVGALNLCGIAPALWFQRVITYGFIAVMAALLVAGVVRGSAAHWQPLFTPPAGHWLPGFFWIFATCAMLLYGFQSALYVIEERAAGVDVRAATRSMVLGIVGAAIFYAATVLAACSIVPWRSILDAELPAVAAFDALSSSGLIGRLILVVSLCSLAKTWNAVVMMASRLLLAQAEAGLLPGFLGRRSAVRGTPANAVLFVTGASLCGIVLGRGALVPLIDMATLCVALIIVLMMATLLTQRRRAPSSPGFSLPAARVTLPLALVGAAAMALFALLQPLWRERGVPLEWELMAAWSALGLLFHRLMRQARVAQLSAPATTKKP